MSREAPHTHSCVHTSLRSPPSVLDGTPGGGAGQRVHVQRGDRFNLLLRCLMTRVVLFMEIRTASLQPSAVQMCVFLFVCFCLEICNYPSLGYASFQDMGRPQPQGRPPARGDLFDSLGVAARGLRVAPSSERAVTSWGGLAARMNWLSLLFVMATTVSQSECCRVHARAPGGQT